MYDSNYLDRNNKLILLLLKMTIVRELRKNTSFHINKKINQRKLGLYKSVIQNFTRNPDH